MHDFRQLSPFDFENLVRDLLQEEIKLRIESFGPGKDGGVDFRFAKAGKTTVIQVKHYVDTPPKALVRAAAKEDEKVARLKPDRYILATSAGLTPALKDKLIAAMPNAPLTRDDVLGREDINNLLERNPKVLRQHFKLWLTHTATLERIVHSGVYNRTDAELELIKNLVPRFVQNRSVEQAEAILESRGALIIAGEPGVGKTTLARVLTWLHLDQGWRVFVVDDLKEAMEVCTPDEKRLIFLDDFLGQISLTNDTIRNVDQRLPIFLDRVRSNKNLRFVLTTRRYLLSQAQQQSARLASEKVIASELILNVGTYTRSIRAQIVYNHIYFSDLSKEEKHSLLSEDFYLRMIDHPNFSPRLIDLLTTADYLALQNLPVNDVVLRVLDNPAELWETPYRSHLTEDSRTVMLSLFFSGLWVSTENLFQSFKRIVIVMGGSTPESTIIARFRLALKLLEGSITSHWDEYVHFSNPGVQDFLSNVIVEDQLLPLVVQASGTFDELNEAWDFYKKHNVMCRLYMRDQSIWITALGRLIAEKNTSTVRVVFIGLSICDFFEVNDLALSFTEQVLQLLKIAEIDAGEERYYRQSLEKFQDLSCAQQQCLPSSDALAQSAADMLASCGNELSLDDIQAIARSIETYGENPILAKKAASAALGDFLSGFSDRLWEQSSVDELDIFEYDLIKLLKLYDVAFDSSLQMNMRNYRSYLEQEGSEDDEERYTSGSQASDDTDMSDTAIRSLFVTLI
ncbi:restriction endonuclease [Pseudomonas sp. B14-6]|uniref:nSTAND3 domain-containing NTPase n=1 Tax=Pseudomonas sp. B14-6 TaxID=2738843 RepID=UPI00155F40AD|nr:restriction endonuclease [Pseudomonas sp. B14-6]QKG65766.1 restriction endonuclease [Pseudomonas sp. B14-6]